MKTQQTDLGGFVMLPVRIIDEVMPKLKPFQTVVLLYLIRHSMRRREGVANETVGQIARGCNMSVRQAQTALAALCTLGILIRRGDKSRESIYAINYGHGVSDAPVTQYAPPKKARLVRRSSPPTRSNHVVNRPVSNVSRGAQFAPTIYRSVRSNSYCISNSVYSSYQGDRANATATRSLPESERSSRAEQSTGRNQPMLAKRQPPPRICLFDRDEDNYTWGGA